MAPERIQIIIDGDAKDYVAATTEARAASKGLGDETRKQTRETEAANSAGRQLNTTLGDTSKRSRAAAADTDRFNFSVGKANRNVTFLRNNIALLKWPALIAGLGGAAQALSALAGGAVALTGALAPLIGLATQGGTAFGILGQAIAAIGLATSGVGDALSAYTAQQLQAGTAATQSAEQISTAHDQVRSSEQSLATAQRSVRLAQEGLTQAREEATRQLQDMRDAADDSRLTEQRAALSLRQAQQALRQALADPSTGRLELADLRLSVKESRDALQDARREGERAREDARRADRLGVSGSEQVVSARRSLADANRSVADAERQLADAQRGVSEAMRDGGSAADTFAQKMGQLSPAAQGFVRTLISLKPRLDDLRASTAQNLFPGVARGIEAAMRNFGPFQRVVNGTSRVLGNLTAEAGRFVGSKAFGRDFERVGETNNRVLQRMGRGAINLGAALTDLMVAARPLTDWLSKSALGWTENIRKQTQAAREAGKLTAFFEETEGVTERLFSLFGHLGSALWNIIRLGKPLGDEILERLDEGAANLERWTKSVGGRNAIKEYFEQIGPPLFEAGRLLGDMTETFLRLGTQPGLRNLLHQLRVELLPVLESTIASTTEAFGPHLIELLTQLLGLFARLAGASGPLTLYVDLLAGAAKFLNDMFDALPGLKTMVVTMIGFATVVKAMKFGAAITGINTMIAAQRRLTGATTASTVATTASTVAMERQQVVATRGVLLPGLGSTVAQRARTAAPIPGTVGGGIAGGLRRAAPLSRAGGWMARGGVGIAGMLGGGAGMAAIASVAAPLAGIAAAMKGIDETGLLDSGGPLTDTKIGGLLGIEAHSLEEKGAAMENLVLQFRGLQQAVEQGGEASRRQIGDYVSRLRELQELDVEGPSVDALDRLLRARGNVSQELIEQARQELHDLGLDDARITAEITSIIDRAETGAQQARQALRGRRKGLGFADALADDKKLMGPEVAGILRELAGMKQPARREAADTMIGMAKVMEDKGQLPKGSAESLRKAVVADFQKMKVDSVRESGRMALQVSKNTAVLVSAVTAGLDLLKGNVVKALEAFGVKALKFTLKKPDKAGALAGQIVGMFGAKGGFAGQLPGYSRTDDQVIGVRGGEAVLRPEDHIPIVETALRGMFGFGLKDLFSRSGAGMSRKPGSFAAGGFVGMQPGITKLMKTMIGRFGGYMSSGLRPGDDGFHGRGMAGDWVGGNWAGAARFMNSIGRQLLEGIYTGAHGGPSVSWDSGKPVSPSFWGAGTWADHASHIHAALAGMVKGAVTKIARVILQGPDGPLKEMGQSALDKAHKAANAYLRRQMPTLGAEVAGTVSGSGAGLMRKISAQRGWNFADWWALDAAETSHGRNLVNPSSTARLRGQFLDMNWGKYGPGSDPRGNPSMEQQIISMAQYIAERYGNPTRAWAFHQANNWYARGGQVGGGPPTPGHELHRFRHLTKLLRRQEKGHDLNRHQKRMLWGFERHALGPRAFKRFIELRAALNEQRELGPNQPLGAGPPSDWRWLRRTQNELELALSGRIEAQQTRRGLGRERRAERRWSRQLNEALGPVFDEFMGGLDLPFLGAFQHGGRLRRDGFLLGHRDEMIQPDPAGPFGSTLPGRGAHDPQQVEVRLVVAEDPRQMVKVMDARIDGRTAKIVREVDRTIGRDQHRLATAPGGTR
jgi:hypothetical protein